jgi:hypothetical protein
VGATARSQAGSAGGSGIAGEATVPKTKTPTARSVGVISPTRRAVTGANSIARHTIGAQSTPRRSASVKRQARRISRHLGADASAGQPVTPPTTRSLLPHPLPTLAGEPGLPRWTPLARLLIDPRPRGAASPPPKRPAQSTERSLRVPAQVRLANRRSRHRPCSPCPRNGRSRGHPVDADVDANRREWIMEPAEGRWGARHASEPS